MRSGFPEVEEQESTRIEKVLVFALVVFLLVGGIWTLGRIENNFPEPVLHSYRSNPYDDRATEASQVPAVEDELGVTPIRSEVEKLQEVMSNREATLSKSRAAQQKASADYEFRREEYRTAMEGRRVTSAQQTLFESTRATYQRSTAELGQAQAAYDLAGKRLSDRVRELDAAADRAQKVYESRLFQRNTKLFAFHFGYAAACLLLSWFLWQAGKRARWRYQTILSAFFIASIVQLLLLLFRYSWELFLDEYAALVISALGTALCIFAIVGIKRWLFSPERLAEARLANQRCPLCATPFADTQTHCWHCGKPLVEKCQTCGEDRLRYAPHCGKCGAGR